MQTPIPIPPSTFLPHPAHGKNGLIVFGFILSLIAFVLLMIFNMVTGYITAPMMVARFRLTREVWNLLTYLPAIFGFIGTLGFLFSLIGTMNELSKKSLSQYFTAFTGMGMGFFGFLIMAEYAIKTIQNLIR